MERKWDGGTGEEREGERVKSGERRRGDRGEERRGPGDCRRVVEEEGGGRIGGLPTIKTHQYRPLRLI